MNFKKRLHILLILLLTLVPSIVFAYPKEIILGGENIGIKVNSKNVIVVGFYKVNNKYIGEEAGLKIGDKIVKINDIKIESIDEMVNIINNVNNNTIKISYIRDNKENETELTLIKDKNNVLKSGLYVKDTINGLGTLTYINTETNKFGALGHEIADKNTYKKVDIKDGIIYDSEVIEIIPSKIGEPGSKIAKFYTNSVLGNIYKNTDKGIYGIVTDKVNGDKITVADKDEIKLGSAKIRTVINGYSIKEYNIDIIEIDKNNNTKNLLFKITDKDLLETTGGIISGMSGSPIIQNNKIIGAVTHVVVNDPEKGYGIFITSMLEEEEKE